jgi:hypothetical protein
MGRNWDENSTNVRINHEREPSLFWSLLSDWTVGEITPELATEDTDALEYELFHRDTREGVLPKVTGK